MVSPFLPMRWPITSALPGLSDDPDIFPALPGQSFLLSKSPLWSTSMATAQSGRVRPRQLWSYPKWMFKLSYEVLRDGPSDLELQRLLTFFNMRAGRAGQFHFYDPTDNAVSGAQFGTGNGITTTFQLTRTTAIGSLSFTEPVRGVFGTPVVAVAGTATTAFTLSTDGRVTFTSAPASGAALTWAGSMMFLCRFDQDQLDVAQMMQSLWSQSGLSFVSVKK